jgi:hypothetical protein
VKGVILIVNLKKEIYLGIKDKNIKENDKN